MAKGYGVILFLMFISCFLGPLAMWLIEINHEALQPWIDQAQPMIHAAQLWLHEQMVHIKVNYYIYSVKLRMYLDAHSIKL